MIETPRILFVDDEPNVTSNLRLLLRKQPWEVVTANSGQEGLACIRDRSFDVVVSDERMPEMSGSEFLGHVARECPESIRIILSGQASLESTIRAINEAGIFRFLTKPCEQTDLIACIEAALQASRDARIAQGSVAVRVPEDAILALPEALKELSLVFQPIIDGRSHNRYGFETLVRSANPHIPHPGVLFDAAEASGRVLEVEAAIRGLVGEALRDSAPRETMFVNLHPSTLGDPDFFLEENPLFEFADRVVLEITERASLSSIDDIEGRLRALRDRGFRIAIDDLGAGYSGLNSFAQLQPDLVKFDIELIREIHQSTTKQRVVESMVRLGRELNFTTVAEGIETAGELETVLALGCELLQGFYLARPSKSFTEFVWPIGTMAEGSES